MFLIITKSRLGKKISDEEFKRIFGLNPEKKYHVIKTNCGEIIAKKMYKRKVLPF